MLPLELRKSFQVVTGVAGWLCALVCALTVYLSLPAETDSAKIALWLMFIGTPYGFINLLQRFLPLLLLKLWPGLETPSKW